jgi:hypothetical protein
MHLNAKATGERRRWTKDEDTRLKKAVVVQTHDGETKNWDAIAALVPGRTRTQCISRWYSILDPRNFRTTTRMDKWTPDEDDNLKDAVQMHNGKNWFEITKLVPGRTRTQCRNRWDDTLDARIVRTTARTGKWTPDEDNKLKEAVKRHHGKNWSAIARLVVGRTRKQCRNRWREAFDPRDDWTTARTGKWTLDEDAKLKDARLANMMLWDALTTTKRLAYNSAEYKSIYLGRRLMSRSASNYSTIFRSGFYLGIHLRASDLQKFRVIFAYVLSTSHAITAKSPVRETFHTKIQSDFSPRPWKRIDFRIDFAGTLCTLHSIILATLHVLS